MTRAKKHVHKYHKITLTFGQVWACALPTCNHYMPKHLEANVPGKMSICWKCGDEFILDESNMKDNQPFCEECKPTTQSIGNLLREKYGIS